MAPPAPPVAPTSLPGPSANAAAANLKDSLLAEIRAARSFFYNAVIAQAQRVDVASDRVTFTFLPSEQAKREQFEKERSWLESVAERVVGRRVMVEAVQGAPAAADSGRQQAGSDASKRDLKADAMNSSTIQAVLDVFPAEIRDVEEMEP
jgi:hypothetical protein